MRKKGLFLVMALLVSLLVLPLVSKAAPDDIPDILSTKPTVMDNLSK